MPTPATSGESVKMGEDVAEAAESSVIYMENITPSQWAANNINPLITTHEDMRSVMKLLVPGFADFDDKFKGKKSKTKAYRPREQWHDELVVVTGAVATTRKMGMGIGVDYFCENLNF